MVEAFPMGTRYLASLVLALFIAGLFPTTVGEVLHALGGDPSAIQANESHCPDPGDDGSPCGPDCACTCCPGQRVAVTFPVASAAIAAPISTDFDVSLPANLHPTTVDRSIFHPPRA
jgi:hypothetical protein